MTTEIATTTAAAIAPAAPVILEGFEDYDGSEFRPQRISIVQTAKQMSDWAAKQGSFHNSVTDESKDSLDVVVLASKQGQWWGPTFEESMKDKAAGQEVKAWCKSSNGKIPDAEIAEPPARACGACPNFKGVRDNAGNYTPPKCTKIRRLLVEEAVWGPAIFTLRKGAASTVDGALQPFFLRGQHPMSVRMTITTKKETNGVNDWYEPVFKSRHDEPTSTEAQSGYRETLRNFATTMATVAEADTHGEEIPSNAPRAPGPSSPGPSAPPDIQTTAVPAEDDIGF